jgi:PAS domain S-box-containing protein
MGLRQMDIDIGRLVDVRPGLVWAASPDRARNYLNQRWREFCGPASSGKTAVDWGSSIHPQDLQRVQACWEATLASGDPGEVEARLRRLDGAYRRFSIRTAPIRDAVGGVVCWCGICTDIESPGRAEQAALPSSQDAELLGANSGLLGAQALSHVGIFTVDLLRDEHIWSDEMRRIWEVEPGDVITQAEILRRIHPDDQERCVAEYARVLEGAETDFALRLVTPSGKVKYVRSTARILTYVNGGPVVVGAYHDETERVIAEQALRASEAELMRANRELKEAQAMSHVGSYSADLSTGEYAASEELRRTWEFEADAQISFDEILRRIHPADRAAFEAEYARVYTGSSSDFAFRIVTPSGKVRHLHSVSRIAEYVEGGPVVVGTQQDETERVLAEQALKASEAELRRAYDFLSEAQRLSKTGSFTWDEIPEKQIWSDEMFRILDLDPSTVITVPLAREMTLPEDRHLFDDMAERSRTEFDLGTSYRVVTSRGAVKHVHVVAHRLEDITDRAVFIGALQDVTESKLAQEALRATEVELRRANSELSRAHGHITAAQRLSQTGSFIWDVTADEHHWSDELYRIAEVDPGVTINMERVRACIHPEDWPVLEAAIEQAMAGSDFDCSGRIVTPTGLIKNFHIVGQRIESVTDRLVFVGALRDVTESKAAEDALNKARGDLAHASRVMALGALTASIAHEVNQPLAGIVANAATCLRMLAADPPNVEGAQATAQRLVRDGNRAAEVVQRLRALFANKPPALEAVDLNEAAIEVLALSSAELQAAKVLVRSELEPGLPPVRGDRVQLQQVILNLVLNAADAMRAVDEKVRELTVNTAREADDCVRLSVRDVGVGVDPENVEKLFEAFHTTKESGMGVGLAVSRSIIESHEGRLWAVPNQGPGATFAFAIRAHPGTLPPSA